MEGNVEKFRIREINVPVPWGNLAAVCWGDPSSELVLSVHGIQDNAGTFDRLIPLLPNNFYYVCLDLPGHGKSSRTPQGVAPNFMHYVEVIHRFVTHFSWSRFYYLGHSLGGQLGFFYATMYPEHVIKLIVLDTIPLLMYSVDEFIEFHKRKTENIMKFEEKMKKSSPPNYTYEQAIERLIKSRPSPLSREGAEALAKRSLKKGENGYHFSTDQRLKFGVRSFISSEQNMHNLSLLQCPTLIIMTKITHTAFSKENNNFGRWKSVIDKLSEMQNVTMILIDGYHDIHNDEPETVAPYISHFLVHQRSSL